MLDSFTFVEHDKLALAIDEYEDMQINRIINKWIANAVKERYQKSWFRVREYTIDQALDFIIKRSIDSWGDTLSYSIRSIHKEAEGFRRLLKSGNGAYIGSRDSFLLTYIEN